MNNILDYQKFASQENNVLCFFEYKYINIIQLVNALIKIVTGVASLVIKYHFDKINKFG